jgi:hypothetical protein
MMEVARLCAEADARLTTAQKSELIEASPFGAATFSKFLRIGTDARLHTADMQRLLPAHYTTTYAITKLTDEELRWAIAEKVIHPDMKRAELQKWHRELPRKMELAPLPNEADSDLVVANLPTTQTQEAGALSSTVSDDTHDKQDELAVAPEDAPAPEAVTTAAVVAGPSTPPPSDDDIPAFLDRRPLSPDNQRAFDVIETAWEGHLQHLWKNASAVVRERFVAKIREDQ